ncbi:hypothetical protein Goari_017088 [Gossypium aridum]|uniref:Uncharacterized protein n=1 Tax=Gossypium aridum TaxID=34290 RepID=A0A7J8WL04_GOSAI|nr:hypothetical protein [Gossypium aridum]
MTKAVFEDKLLVGVESDDELITVTQFLWIKVTRNDINILMPNPTNSSQKFVIDQMKKSTSNNFGYIVNSFHELEKVYVNSWNSEATPKVWYVEPLCIAEPERKPQKKPFWIQWLDQKLAQGKRESESLDEGFEERVKERGIVVKQWVDQSRILKHQCVEGFLSHCGWNSALESICYGVSILAWPKIAEQALNARMVVEEIKLGLRVESTCNGMKPLFLKWEGLMKMVKELMEGEMGKQARKRVKQVAELGKMAMADADGSYWQTLDLLINELCNK